jgi:hypothetical protein
MNFRQPKIIRDDSQQVIIGRKSAPIPIPIRREKPVIIRQIVSVSRPKCSNNTCKNLAGYDLNESLRGYYPYTTYCKYHGDKILAERLK